MAARARSARRGLSAARARRHPVHRFEPPGEARQRRRIPAESRGAAAARRRARPLPRHLPPRRLSAAVGMAPLQRAGRGRRADRKQRVHGGVREPRAGLAHPGENLRGPGAPAARPRSDRVQPVADPALNVQPVVDWLTEGAPPSRLPRDVLLETCRRTVAAGLPIHRVGVFVRTLHPNLLGRAFIWQADKGAVEMTEAGHDLLESEAFLKSPIRTVMTENVEVRRRLADAACPMDFPILEDLRKDGATDFVAVPLRFINGEVHAASFATRSPGGFRDDELAALRRLLAPFTRMVEIFGNMQKARNILAAYLGPSAGEKVLAGQIRRGDGQD